MQTHINGVYMKVFKKVLNIIIDILIAVVLVVSIFVAISALTTKANGMPSVFGFTFQSIQSDSMKGGSDKFEGGDFEKGDLIISKTTGYDSEAEYDVGDIVTYSGRLEGAEDAGDQLICHRIVGTSQVDNNSVVYQLQGDNPEAQKIDEIPASSIVAKYYTKDYQGKVLKGWGNFYDFITSQTGFFLCILLPMIIFFLYAMIRVVISAMNYRKDKEKDAKEEAEKEKQEAVDAAVKAALAAKGGEDANPADTPADMTPEQMEQFKQFLAFQKAQQSAETPESPAEEAAESTKE